MHISKRVILPLAAVAVIGAAALGAAQVSAATDSTGQSLAGRLAKAFNLDQSKVQAVLDEHRADHQAQMEQRFEDRLTQAVTNGKLTAAQKDAILAKRKEIRSKLEAGRDLTDAAKRRELFESVRTDAQNWAKDQGIDAKWLVPGKFGPGGHGGHGFRMMPPDDAASDAPSS